MAKFKRYRTQILPTSSTTNIINIDGTFYYIDSRDDHGGGTYWFYDSELEEVRHCCFCEEELEGGEYKHLYVLSDEEIPKDGDKVIPIDSNFSSRVWEFKKAPCPLPYWGWENTCKKIIATTDPSLGLPRPSESFIKEYCELGGIDEVLVEYLEKEVDDWEPLILKVAPDNTITIKKGKDSWTREEVKILLLQACIVHPNRIEEWIEKNL